MRLDDSEIRETWDRYLARKAVKEVVTTFEAEGYAKDTALIALLITELQQRIVNGFSTPPNGEDWKHE